MIDWIPVEIGMPIPYKPVLVEGGCAYWDGIYWYTYMERNHPKIEWEVKCWALMPNPNDNSKALKKIIEQLKHMTDSISSRP